MSNYYYHTGKLTKTDTYLGYYNINTGYKNHTHPQYDVRLLDNNNAHLPLFLLKKSYHVVFVRCVL